jgi:hypothetical protein
MSKFYKIITLLSFQIGVNVIGLPIYYEVRWREVNKKYVQNFINQSKYHR